MPWTRAFSVRKYFNNTQWTFSFADVAILNNNNNFPMLPNETSKVTLSRYVYICKRDFSFCTLRFKLPYFIPFWHFYLFTWRRNICLWNVSRPFWSGQKPQPLLHQTVSQTSKRIRANFWKKSFFFFFSFPFLSKFSSAVLRGVWKSEEDLSLF